MKRLGLLIACVAPSLLAACRQDMHDQPRLKPLARSAFFEDERAARPRVPGTVARGEGLLDPHLQTGRLDGKFAATFPFPITADVLERGEQRFAINCTPCHDHTGSGLGMAVRRGVTAPPSLHELRLREAPPGYFFDVMTNGYGAMYDVSDRVTAHDRWAIAAWIRVLQRSQTATLADVPADERARLEEELR